MSLPENDDQIVLLHNPRCSKSRAAKVLLDERSVDYVERLYLEDPLTIPELTDLGARLGRAASGWMRTREAAFAEAGLSASSTDEELLAGVGEHPILMERPILIRGQRAAIGRPLEDIQALLDQ
ncbi:MAG: arsenate reductase [Planctomycetota bacterium]|jgi:arsenate reductase